MVMIIKPTFRCSKWTDFTICVVNIIAVISVFIIVIRANSARYEVNKEGNNETQFGNSTWNATTPHYLQIHCSTDDWKTIKIILILCVVGVVLLHTLGLIAILKEYLRLIAAYSLITVVMFIVFVVARIKLTAIFLPLFMLNLPLSFCSFMFYSELYKRRNVSNNLIIISKESAQQYPNPAFINEPPPAPTQHNQVAPNQSPINPTFTNQPSPNLQYPNQVYPSTNFTNEPTPTPTHHSKVIPNQIYPSQSPINPTFTNQTSSNTQYPNQGYPSFPCQPSTSQTFPTHDNHTVGYPAPFQVGETTVWPVHPLCTGASVVAPSPYDYTPNIAQYI